MTFDDLLPRFRQLADLADIRGASLEAAGWRQLAGSAEHGGDDHLSHLRDLAARGRLEDVGGVPPSVRLSLAELLNDGPDGVLRAARAGLPKLLRRLLEFGVADVPGVAALAQSGILTIGDLDAAFHDGRIDRHFGAIADRLRIAADALSFERRRSPLGRAFELLDHVARLLRAECPELEDVVIAGDVRRFEPLAESLVIVCAAADPNAALDRITSLDGLRPVLHRSARRAIVTCQLTEIDIRVAAPDEFGTTLFTATGSIDHLLAMRARQPALRLAAREEDVYSHAGLPWIPPEMRHGTGEIEAAADGHLPSLVSREHIRGDLHMHSTYSDGRDSLADMVKECALLGYEYIAITDHSERSAASRTVTRDSLQRQRREIARLRRKFPQMAILHGIEVDIMPDGTLDFPDDVLEPLDIVLASLHDPANQDPETLTRRCLAAIQHPLVNIITHPANRLVGRNAGYQLDFPAVFAAAIETGTALEIDGAPAHLDMDGALARAAVAAGVTVTIDSDCHRASLLERQMQFGVGTARRGWVEPRHVLNARPLAEVRAFIAAKRRRLRV